jgi:hypothetical protein
MKLPPPAAPKNWGLWDIDNIRVRYISDTWVQFSCEHKIINGETEIVNVGYTLLDRIRGIGFDQKVKSELIKFIDKMQQRNKKILQLREKERLVRDYLRAVR